MLSEINELPSTSGGGSDKKLSFYPLLVLACLAAGGTASAQQRGEVDLLASGSLLSRRGSQRGVLGFRQGSSLSSSFSLFGGYFAGDRVRIDGGLSFFDAEGIDAALSLSAGARYFFWSRGRHRLDGGGSLTVGLLDGGKRSVSTGRAKTPLDVSVIPLEYQFWPLPGGAVTVGLEHQRRFVNGGDRSLFLTGLNVGILVRLK